MTSQDRVAKQFSALQQVLGAIDQNVIMGIVAKLERVRETKGTVWVIGNGGSSATASHFANDLHKAAHFRAIALSDMTATVTAYGNDDGWISMYSHALHLMMIEKDCLVAISCSGRSQNILEAAKMAGSERLVILTGSPGPTNTLASTGNSGIVYAQSDDIKVQESAHSAICHAIVAGLIIDPMDWHHVPT